jgi:uncharacterized protein YecE (DUF72 family)
VNPLGAFLFLAVHWVAKGLTASSERFNYEYSDEEIEQLSEQVNALVERAIQVQVLVNVNHEDQGVRAAQRLERVLKRLEERGAS